MFFSITVYAINCGLFVVKKKTCGNFRFQKQKHWIANFTRAMVITTYQFFTKTKLMATFIASELLIYVLYLLDKCSNIKDSSVKNPRDLCKRKKPKTFRPQMLQTDSGPCILIINLYAILYEYKKSVIKDSLNYLSHFPDGPHNTITIKLNTLGVQEKSFIVYRVFQIWRSAWGSPKR